MEIYVCKDSKELGEKAAQHVGRVLRECIQEKGEARIVLSTGASQLDTLEALVQEDVDWSKVDPHAGHQKVDGRQVQAHVGRFGQKDDVD